MITLRYSLNHGLSCQVYDDNRLIGRVHIEKKMTSDKFLAIILGDAKDAQECLQREFDTIFDALDWLEERRGKSTSA